MAAEYSQNRTNVRLLKWALATAEVVAPAWLEEKAFRAWGHPQRRPGRWGELEASARKFVIDTAGGDAAAWEWNVGGAEGTALLVHGWSGNAAQLRAFVEPLTRRGFHVVAVDVPAHGSSPGEFMTLPIFANVVLSLGRRLMPRLIVAHSFGATATVTALGQGLQVERVALLAPPVEMPPYLRHFANLVGLSPKMQDRLLARVARYLGHPLEEMDLRRVAPRLGRTQALVLHDRADDVSPFKGSRELAEVWPGATFVETFGYGHDGVRRVQSVVDTVTEFCVLGTAPEPRALQSA